MDGRLAVPRSNTVALVGGLALFGWLTAVIAAAASGMLVRLGPIEYGSLVMAGIVVPTVAYFAWPGLRGAVDAGGLRTITALHVWRVVAGLAFVAYGMSGALPPLFWIPAGVGDVMVGLYATRVFQGEVDAGYYRRFHAFGLADFVVAVGSGLAHSLALDPRMAAVSALPLAVIPLFGVGLSGASHVVAFGLLNRGQTPFRHDSVHVHRDRTIKEQKGV